MADWRRCTGRIATNSDGIVGGVSVTVNQAGTSTKCTLKANKAGTEALDNPFETDAYGIWSFFVDAETLVGVDYEVDIVFSKAGCNFSEMNEMYENVAIQRGSTLSGVSSTPGSGQYTITDIYLDESLNMVIVYDDVAEA